MPAWDRWGCYSNPKQHADFWVLSYSPTLTVGVNFTSLVPSALQLLESDC